MKKLDRLHEYMDRRVKIVDTDGKEWTGLCWGVYSAAENGLDSGVEEDSVELYDGATATVLYAGEIRSIEILA